MIGFPVEPDGTWCEIRRRPLPGGPALFLDRDGVMIRDCHYLSDPDGVILLDGIVAIMAAAEARGVPSVIVSNQSGIGRGMFGWDAFRAVQDRMLAELAWLGVAPTAVLACPHHPEAQEPHRLADPPMRKPNPGMILRAAELLALDAPRSLMIGDKEDDMLAAAAGGLQAGILVGRSSPAEQSIAPARPGFASMTVYPVATVRDAIFFVEEWLACHEDATQRSSRPAARADRPP